MKGYLILIIVIIGFSCQNRARSFYELCEQARQENKYFCLNLNFRQDDAILDTFRQYEKKYSDSEQEILFRQFNVVDSTYAFLSYILLVENTNSLYFFNPQGELVTFSNQPVTPEGIRRQWEAIRRGKPELPRQAREFLCSPDTLLAMQNLVLKAYRLYRQYPHEADSLQYALNLVEEAINIEPYFYNLYLRGKLAEMLGKEDAKEFATLAVQYCKEGYQKTIYFTPLQELAQQYDLRTLKGKGIIEFQETMLSAGKIPLHAKHEFCFPFRNTGEEPVIIAHVSSTCGCATPEWKRRPVLPGGTDTIKVVFNADKYGNFVRSIFVQSTAQNYLEHLYLRGNVSLDLPPQE